MNVVENLYSILTYPGCTPPPTTQVWRNQVQKMDGWVDGWMDKLKESHDRHWTQYLILFPLLADSNKAVNTVGNRIMEYV